MKFANEMDSETYEDICKKLDDVSLKLFELLETLMEERIKLNDIMKFAFVDMAKARYSVGNHRVSSLQLDMKEMVALKHIVSNTCTSSGYSFNSYTVEETSSITEDNAVKEECGIRKRISHTNSGDTDINKTETMELNSISSVCDVSTEKKTIEAKSDVQKMHDPLKWFGILTPQSLRNCQKYFQQSIHNVASIASIQSEIKALIGYMENLKAEKKKWLELKSSEL